MTFWNLCNLLILSNPKLDNKSVWVYNTSINSQNGLKMTYDNDIVSDLHKDAFGFRPSQCWWEQWKSNTPAEKQAEWDSLIKAMEASCDEEKEREDRAVVAFEALVTKTINSGAKTREAALRWIMESSRCDGDWEYLCFTHGLPYSYFKKVA
ncbi:MAG: hypothetical protein WCR20_14805 [Verrucomicrobiota bacterium]